jgi:tripartite-type tricarboxylate transporter receptor subunit TctC
VVAQLHAAVTRALQDPELRARFTGQGMEVVPSPTPDAFNRFMKDEVARYRQLARDANIRVE